MTLLNVISQIFLRRFFWNFGGRYQIDGGKSTENSASVSAVVSGLSKTSGRGAESAPSLPRMLMRQLCWISSVRHANLFRTIVGKINLYELRIDTSIHFGLPQLISSPLHWFRIEAVILDNFTPVHIVTCVTQWRSNSVTKSTRGMQFRQGLHHRQNPMPLSNTNGVGGKWRAEY